jgi:hypothetical protein
MRYYCVLVSIMAMVAGGQVPAACQEDVRGISLPRAENRLIDEKCLGCHNRQKIDAAVKQRKSMEKIMRQMEEKGVTLTDADRQVLGHFWQQDPFKRSK